MGIESVFSTHLTWRKSHSHLPSALGPICVSTVPVSTPVISMHLYRHARPYLIPPQARIHGFSCVLLSYKSNPSRLLCPYSRSLMSTLPSSIVAPVPRLSASLIVINNRNEILLVHRNPKATAFGGMHVGLSAQAV